MTQATLSAGQSRTGFKRARDIAAPAHLGDLIAAKPRIQAMVQDAVWAGLLREQILETRLSEVIETATSTSLNALDNDEQATPKLHVQKASQAADEAWQHIIRACKDPASQTRQYQPSNIPAPPLKMITVRTWTSQRPGRADSVRCSSKRSFHDSLIGLVSGV